MLEGLVLSLLLLSAQTFVTVLSTVNDSEMSSATMSISYPFLPGQLLTSCQSTELPVYVFVTVTLTLLPSVFVPLRLHVTVTVSVLEFGLSERPSALHSFSFPVPDFL